jgi:hypothetical protein
VLPTNSHNRTIRFGMALPSFLGMAAAPISPQSRHPNFSLSPLGWVNNIWQANEVLKCIAFGFQCHTQPSPSWLKKCGIIILVSEIP